MRTLSPMWLRPFFSSLEFLYQVLLEMARSRTSKKSRKHSKRYRKHRGGAGSGFEPDGRLSAAAPYAMVHKAYDGCMAATRPGAISFSASGGLPGMRGGAYTNNLSSSIAGFPVIQRDTSHCSSGQKGGASDMGVLQESTARYSMAPSDFKNSVGAPMLLSQPLNQVAWSKACTSTGGARRRHTKKSRKSKKSKKSRKHRK